MPRAAIFIDGAYLDFILRDHFGLPRIDYHRLANELAGDVEILRTYYYHCPPYQSSPPSQEERERFSRADKFHKYLERLPRYEVRLGRLAKRYDQSGNPVFEQKRVDIRLGVDMALLAGKNQITHAILLAGDSDFLPAVIAAKSEGVLVHLYHGPTYHKDLWDQCDERTLMTEALVRRVRAR